MQILEASLDGREETKLAEKDICTHCKEKPAEIFQVTGEFCLDCWQIITHTIT